MSYAIVGFGKIGQALAHAFARKIIDATVRESPTARRVGTAGTGDSTGNALPAELRAEPDTVGTIPPAREKETRSVCR